MTETSQVAQGWRERLCLLVWGGAALLILCSLGRYAEYAADVVQAPFGLNYSEGLIWQQALWILGPHAYARIDHGPYLVFEYPPVFPLALRALIACGVDGLKAGRALSVVSTVVAAGLLGGLTARLSDPRGRVCAGAVAACLPFTLLPVLSWSPLLRVDMLGLAATYAGLMLAAQSSRRPAALYGALLAFVVACYTKQIFVSAPLAVLALSGLRDWRLALKAGACGLTAGLIVLVLLEWRTDGGFLRHILLYNVNRFSVATALQQAGLWIAAYPTFVAASALACAMWARAHLAQARERGWIALLRADPQVWLQALVVVYIGLTTCTLLLAGKSGASINYFIEWLCALCVPAGWLCGLAWVHRGQTASVAAPAILAAQLVSVPGAIGRLDATQLSQERRAQAAALYRRVAAIPGQLLSDDMVLTLRAGRSVIGEPFILAELAVKGLWDESTLIGLLKTHAFGAVITAYDPGDPTFDARYLPATQAALLAAYPIVESYGPYRLRRPALELPSGVAH
jgi:hypothetical protein